MSLPLIAILCVALQAAPGKQLGLAQAVQLIRADKLQQALDVLEPLAEEQPHNANAWLWLGVCYHKQENWEKAIPAHQQAANYLETAGEACFNLACSWSLQGDVDRSFDWLRESWDSGYDKWDKLWLNPDLLALRGDERFTHFAGISPNYEHPFVEPTEILFTWHGENAGDQFGWVAVDAGDVDGDGIHDVITSAPFLKIPGARGNAGRVYVYSGSTGKLIRTHTGNPGDALGLSVSEMGDLNADGYGDYAASSPCYGNPERAGSIEVWSGRDGLLLFSIKGQEPGDGFGRTVERIFDVNGDGTTDIIVGSERWDEGRGQLSLHSGKDGSMLHSWKGEGFKDNLGSTVCSGGSGDFQFLVAGAMKAGEHSTGRMLVYRFLPDEQKFVEYFRVDADKTNGAYGQFFSSVIGDLNGDGVGDVYTVDFSASAGGVGSGQVRMLSGKDGAQLWSKNGSPGEGLGIGNAIAGDCNGDGHADVITGAWTDSAAAEGGGSHYLLSGVDGSVLRKWTCTVPGANMGFDSTSLPDCNRDGRRDFLFSAASSSVRGAKCGSVYLVSGADPVLPKGE